ncbi:MAG: M20/M25/M40 family metallo-hydrolase [Acidimicrobiia bacterium]|nr:M20/M25/M40 family metallo-hydrolase [Acidimicrobiia bacterium]
MSSPFTPDLSRIIDDIEAMVLCESPSEDAAALAASARVVAAVGERTMGVTPEVVAVDDVTHLRWRFGSRPKVLILAHHDTVWPLGSLVTHPWSVEDGIIRGPGCFDMKTGIAMSFHALAGVGPADGVTLMVTGDEEVGSPTGRALIEEEAAGCDAVLVLEASAPGGALKTRRKGVSLYTCEVSGRAAHAGLEPELGVNAGTELAHQILAIGNLENHDVGTTVTPTVLAGGTTTNTVPASARVAIDVRAWTLAEQERIHLELAGLEPQLEGAIVSVTGGINRPPLETEQSADLFALADRLSVGLHGKSLTQAAVGGGSDGNITAGMGIPTLDGLGAIGGGAHADDEHVITAAIPERTELLAALIADLL